MLTVMSAMKRLRALFLTFSLLLIGGIAIIVACQEKQRRPSRYLIPEGYVGWVRINFNVKGTPPIPIEEGHYLFKFPPSGLIETSSDLEYGWAKDEYYYYCGDTRRKLESTGWGDGGMIWAGYNGSSGNHPIETDIHAGFFVGTEEEEKKYGSEKDENYQPKRGAIDKMKLTCAER